MTDLRVLVVTIVHQPLDARIHARQIRAMRDAGWAVTYAAPWSATATDPDPDLDTVDLPRAVGRRRLHAIRTARGMLRETAQTHDLVLVHDPELLLSAAGLRRLPPVVWDVHEDVAASLLDRAWVPHWLLRPLQLVVRAGERWAERCHHLILAETSYAVRFRGTHPVIRNLPWMPDHVSPPSPGRAVYLGRISHSRGLDTLFAVADLLRPDVTIELIGPADPEVEDVLRQAHDAGRVQWHGFVGNADALALVQGATAGLSLLRDEPNFRKSLPTKVAEYMAQGVPVVTTPLPEAMKLLGDQRSGTIVPFDDAPAVADAVRALNEDSDARTAAAREGRATIASNTWDLERGELLRFLQRLARAPRQD